MINKQASGILKTEAMSSDIPEVREAMLMGAEALEWESCNDTVSRQAAVASIKNLYPDIPIVNIMGARKKWLEKYAPYFECENAIEHLPPVNPQQPNMGHCKDCKYFHRYHEIERVPHITAHNVCYRWGDKCFTKEDGYCYLFEPKEESEDENDN